MKAFTPCVNLCQFWKLFLFKNLVYTYFKVKKLIPEKILRIPMHSNIHIPNGQKKKKKKKISFKFDKLVHSANHTKYYNNYYSHHQKKIYAVLVKTKTELPLFRLVLCSFCVDASYQNEI